MIWIYLLETKETKLENWRKIIYAEYRRNF